jgi:hypothetical protein
MPVLPPIVKIPERKQIKVRDDGTYEYAPLNFDHFSDAMNYQYLEATDNLKDYTPFISEFDAIEMNEDISKAFFMNDAIESNMQPYDSEKKKQRNIDDLEKNHKIIQRHFGDEGQLDKVNADLKKMLSQEHGGNFDYNTAYMYFAGKYKRGKLGWLDKFIYPHPADTRGQWIPIIGSVLGMADLAELAMAAKRMENPPSEDYWSTAGGRKDLELLTLYLDYQEVDGDLGYNVASILNEMPAFAGEIWATGGIATATKKATRETINLALNKLSNEKFKKIIANRAVEVGVKTVAKTGLYTGTLGAPRVGERYQELMLPKVANWEVELTEDVARFLFDESDFTPWEAFANAYGDVAIEYMSELSGGLVKLIPKPQKAVAVKSAIMKAMKKKNPAVSLEKISEVMAKLGYHGIFTEMGEERIGEAARAGLGRLFDEAGINRDGLEEWEFPSGEQLLTELIAFSIPGVGSVAAGKALGWAVGEETIDPNNPTNQERIAEFVEIMTGLKNQPAPVETAMTLVNKTRRKPVERNNEKFTEDYRKKVLNRVNQVGTSELIEFVADERNSDLVDIALGWYGDGFRNAVEGLRDSELPELGDLDNQNHFRALVAAFSLSKAPKENIDFSIDFFKEWIRSGKDPTEETTTYNKAGNPVTQRTYKSDKGVERGIEPAVYNNIKKYMALVEQFGGDTFAADDWMMATHSGADVLKMVKNLGFEKPQNLAMKDKDVFGSEMFGPKVGAFWLNLKGVSDIPTIDRWMTRQIRRWLGNPFAETGGLAMSWSEAKEEYKEIRKLKGKDREKALSKMRESFAKAPTTKDQFILYRHAIQKITDTYNRKTGSDLSADQIQALLWYMEKDLYLRAGSRGTELDLSDFAGAVNERLNKQQSTSRYAKDIGRGESQITRPGAVEEGSDTGTAEPGADTQETGQQDQGEPRDTDDASRGDQGRQQDKHRKAPGDSRQSRLLAPSELTGEDAGETFHKLLIKAKQLLGPLGAQVHAYLPNEYQDTFTDENGIKKTPHIYKSADGRAGYVIMEVDDPKGKYIDIVSVFSDGTQTGVLKEMMPIVIQQAKSFKVPIRLDCYATFLPTLYRKFGFEETGRIKWDDKYMPEDWDKEYFEEEFGNPEPDIVYMEYKDKQPTFADEATIDVDTTGPIAVIRRKIINRMAPFFDLVEEVKNNIGEQRELFENEDLETIAMLSDNKATARTESFYKKLEDFTAKLKRQGLTLDELHEYLYAQHAKERNKVAKERGYEGNDGSGISNYAAGKILKKYNKTQMKAFAAEFRSTFVNPILDIRLESGLISQETYDALKNQFSFYVPLRAELNDEDISTFYKTRGFDTRGREDFSIRGGANKRRNSVVQTMLNLEETIYRAENNQVGLAFLHLARNYDIEGVTVEKLRYRPQFDQDGEISFLLPHRIGRDQFVTTEAGSKYVITVENQGMLDALNRVGKPSVPYLSKVVNFMRAVTTTWSPSFMIRNFVRDLETSMIHLAGEEGNDMASQVAKDVLSFAPARGIIHNELNKEGFDDWSDLYDEMKLAGGKVSWRSYRDFDKAQAEIIEMLEEQRKGGSPLKVGQKIGKYWNAYSDAVEVGVRLSTYKAMRDAGYSKNQSARKAREITVDFNRKGEYGSWLNAMYLFGNANVQGTVRMGKSLFDNSSATQYYAAGMTFMGYSIALMSLGSDPDEYLEQDEFSRYNNINMTAPNIGLKIPLAYGYNLFYALGAMMAEMHWEKQQLQDQEELQYGKYVSGAMTAFANAFSPINFGSFSAAVPTIPGNLIAQYSMNEKWHGGPIRPEGFSTLTKESFRVKPGTPKLYVDFSDAIHTLSGGEVKYNSGQPYRYGGINVHPNDMEHAIEFLGGGLGNLINRTFKTGQHYFNKKTLPPLHNIPFVRIFASSYDDPNKDLRYVYDLLEHSTKDHVYQYQLNWYLDNLNTLRESGHIIDNQYKDLLGKLANNVLLRKGNTGKNIWGFDALEKEKRFYKKQKDPKAAEDLFKIQTGMKITGEEKSEN